MTFLRPQGALPKVEDGYSADEDEREPLSKVRRVGNCDEALSVHSDTGSFFEVSSAPWDCYLQWVAWPLLDWCLWAGASVLGLSPGGRSCQGVTWMTLDVL